MALDTDHRPNVVPWPPLIYLAAALGALGLGFVSPLGFPQSTLAGALLVGTALAVDGAAMLTMARARTNILPHRAAGRLVTHGPFAWSRNPIYLGNTILLIGLAFLLGNGWFLPAAVLAAYATQELAIRREEQHLAARFGSQWQAYAARVPRWLRPFG